MHTFASTRFSSSEISLFNCDTEHDEKHGRARAEKNIAHHERSAHVSSPYQLTACAFDPFHATSLSRQTMFMHRTRVKIGPHVGIGRLSRFVAESQRPEGEANCLHHHQQRQALSAPGECSVQMCPPVASETMDTINRRPTKSPVL
jgi:hypothetical protein